MWSAYYMLKIAVIQMLLKIVFYNYFYLPVLLNIISGF